MIDIIHKKYFVILLIWCFLIINRFFAKKYIVLFKRNSYQVKGIYTWCRAGFGKYIVLFASFMIIPVAFGNYWFILLHASVLIFSIFKIEKTSL